MHTGVGSRRTSGRRLTGLVAAVLVALGAAGSGAPAAGAAPPTTYENPVSRSFADTFADPAILKAKDGAWYSYGTSDPLREGERTFHTIPMARSADMVNWTSAGDAFGAGNRPAWAAPDAGIWAPDVRYIDGRYVMYFGVTNTTLYEGRNDSAIGVATAPTPTGPWTDSGQPVVAPRPGGGGAAADDFLWTFDSTGFTDIDGSHYLYFGSYYGGISVTKLTPDGLRAVGEAPRIAIDNRYEAAYVVRRNGWVYFFGSSANCCAGPTTGYSVYVGRSRSPLEPPVDRDGISLNQSRVGGTVVITPNGNRWIGPGHNAIATDLSGQDWFVYHAIDRADPYLDEPFGINERPMLIDRLDWIDGWPTVRGGRWASEGPQTGPVTTPDAGDDFNGDTPLGARWLGTGSWQSVRTGGESFVGQQAESCARPRFLLSRSAVGGDVRAEADVRLPTAAAAGGVVVRHRDSRSYAIAKVDSARRALVVEAYVNGVRVRRTVRALPADLPLEVWHTIAVEVRGQSLTAELTDARLNDPYAVATLQLPRALADARGAGVASTCGRVEMDNIAITRLYVPQRDRAAVPTLGTLDPAASDTFDEPLDADWEWVRGPDPDAVVAGGNLTWPTESGDTVGPGGNAPLLLRDAPEGNYVAETTCTIDLGTDTIRNYQQCGIVAYVNDDLFLRLSHVSIWNTRQTEFGKEQPFGDPTPEGVQRTSFGGMLIGTPADTTTLRLAHRVDPANGEHEFRAATSRDGRNFTWGGVWTLPAGTEPRIGLVSLGWNGTDPRATSVFDGFRVFRGGSWGELG